MPCDSINSNSDNEGKSYVVLCITITSATLIILLLTLKIYFKITLCFDRSKTSLIGKTVIITEACYGIGYVVALECAKRGGRVILTCKDTERGSEVQQEIKAATGNKHVLFKELDLSSFASVLQFVKGISECEKRVDILINNADTLAKGSDYTEDGLQETMQVNFVSLFMITVLLLCKIKNSEGSRIINVSSNLPKWFANFDPDTLQCECECDLVTYANAKLCLILFTMELAEKVKEAGVTVLSVHPGLVSNGVFSEASALIQALFLVLGLITAKSTEQAAQTLLYCTFAMNIEHLTGQHFENCQPVNTYKCANKPELGTKVWKLAERHMNVFLKKSCQ